MDEIRDAVHDYILREFLPGEQPDNLTDDTPLITGGILDSISTLKLVTYLEERFGITVEAYEAGVDNLRFRRPDLASDYGQKDGSVGAISRRRSPRRQDSARGAFARSLS